MTHEPTEPFEPADPGDLLDETVLVDDPDDTVDPAAPPPPPPPPPGGGAVPGPVRTGLVRDPHSRLGGVASGLAHRYGWDPTLVRLVFVLGLVGSFGTALVAYLIAWVVVPRATYWPPTPAPNPFRNFSNREAAIGLGVAGIIAFLLVDGGPAAGVLVPLALVGGGIWLLTQESRPGAVQPAGEAAPVAAEPVPTFPVQPVAVGQPVETRSRRRKWIIRGAITAVVLAVFATILVPIAVFGVWVADGDGVSFSVGNDDVRMSSYAPRRLNALPASIETDNGLTRVDLRSIPASEFAELTDPVSLDIAMGDGEVWLQLPADLDYALDAVARNGRVETDGLTDGDTVDISRASVVVEETDPDVIITISLDQGDIHIDQD